MKCRCLPVFLFAAIFSALQLLQAAPGANWIPAETDYVIAFNFNRLKDLQTIQLLLNSIDESAAMEALCERLHVSPEQRIGAMFIGGGRKLRALLVFVDAPEKSLHALLMKQRGVQVQNVRGRMFYLLPPLAQKKPLDQPLAVSFLTPGILLVTFEKYAACYVDALQRGVHAPISSKLDLEKAPVWGLIELEKLSVEDRRSRQKRSKEADVYLQLGRSVRRIWGAYLPKQNKLEEGRISIEAECRDAETAEAGSFSLQMVAAIGINAILPDEPETAAKVTDLMVPSVKGASSFINIDVDRKTWLSVSGAIARQYRGDAEEAIRKQQEKRRRRQR